MIISNGPTFHAAHFALVISISFEEYYKGIRRVSSSNKSPTLIRLDLVGVFGRSTAFA